METYLRKLAASRRLQKLARSLRIKRAYTPESSTPRPGAKRKSPSIPKDLPAPRPFLGSSAPSIDIPDSVVTPRAYPRPKIQAPALPPVPRDTPRLQTMNRPFTPRTSPNRLAAPKAAPSRPNLQAPPASFTPRTSPNRLAGSTPSADYTTLPTPPANVPPKQPVTPRLPKSPNISTGMQRMLPSYRQQVPPSYDVLPPPPKEVPQPPARRNLFAGAQPQAARPVSRPQVPRQSYSTGPSGLATPASRAAFPVQHSPAPVQRPVQPQRQMIPNEKMQEMANFVYTGVQNGYGLTEDVGNRSMQQAAQKYNVPVSAVQAAIRRYPMYQKPAVQPQQTAPSAAPPVTQNRRPSSRQQPQAPVNPRYDNDFYRKGYQSRPRTGSEADLIRRYRTYIMKQQGHGQKPPQGSLRASWKQMLDAMLWDGQISQDEYNRQAQEVSDAYQDMQRRRGSY